ncbi:MAG: winged helix-turn-helix transcriptional regulator [Bacteroidetes bacterium]|nr:winged helix-turn-helix transcriptional regulator [Bacteroidota bacterium]
MENFDDYIRQGEPNKAEKAKIWKTAIGLQQVDGLKPSDYLIETARQNIEGDITIEEVKQRIDVYYKQQPVKNDENRTDYKNHTKNIHATTKFLLRFFENLLLNENHTLKNRDMSVNVVAGETYLVKAQNVPVNVPVNDTEKTVLEIIKNNPSTTYDDIASMIKRDRKTVQRAINKLKKLGLIERTGSDKTGHWKIIK